MEKLNNIITNLQMDIKQTLKRMDEMGGKTILMADSKNRLLGTITDGDIRRWILKGNSLSAKIIKVMNRHPILLKEGYLKDDAKQIMLLNKIECIPIVDDNKRIISAIWWTDIFGKDFKSNKPIDIPVVIMAGGEGRRLLPFTNILPKPLMPLGEKPIIELIIDRFAEYGCKDFYLSLNYKADILKAYFNERKLKYKIKYIQEKKPLGTIGGLYLLKNILKTKFFVNNCDILIDADYADIIKFHNDNKNDITIAVSLKHYTIPYGVCDIKNGGILKGIREKPDYDFLVNTGLYLMECKVLKDIPRNMPYHFTDLINDYVKKNKKIGVYPISEKSWFDMGQFDSLQDMLKTIK